MRLRASYTVENSIIVPIFFMIIVAIVSLCCDIHDRIISRATQSQMIIEADIQDLDTSGKEYLKLQAEEYRDIRVIKDKTTIISWDDSNIKNVDIKKVIRVSLALKEIKNTMQKKNTNY